MNVSEIQRLSQDVQKQPALREALSVELKQCDSPTEAAALLQQRGYVISAEDLTATSSTIPDAALDHVVGGTEPGFGWFIGGPLLAAFDHQVRLANGSNWPP